MDSDVLLTAVTYHPIGSVENGIVDPVGPKLIRSVESLLVLEQRFAPAVAALEVGQYLLVIYHLHCGEKWRDALMPDLIARRIACRPNHIGVTLTRIVALCGSTLKVVGLDAIDGSPILDIKLYTPIVDAPPVCPVEVHPCRDAQS